MGSLVRLLLWRVQQRAQRLRMQKSRCTKKALDNALPTRPLHATQHEAVHARAEARDPTRVLATLTHSLLPRTRASSCCPGWRRGRPTLASALGWHCSVAATREGCRTTTQPDSRGGAATHHRPYPPEEPRAPAGSLQRTPASGGRADGETGVVAHDPPVWEGGGRRTDDTWQEENSRRVCVSTAHWHAARATMHGVTATQTLSLCLPVFSVRRDV